MPLLPICIFALLPCAAVTEVSSKIEAGAAEVAAVMSERLQLMQDVAGWKWINATSIEDPERERELLSRVRIRARALGMEPESIARVMGIHFDMAKAIQSYWHAKWRQSGFPQGWQPEDLKLVLRPRLTALADRMLLTLYLRLHEWAGPTGRHWPDMGRLNQFPVEPGIVLQLEQALRAVEQLSLHQVGVLRRIRTSGILRVGTTGDYPPFSLYSQGRWTGVDVDMARDFARALGVRLQIVLTSWPTLMDDFRNGGFDMAMSGVSITAERRRHGYFSDPYHSGGKKAIGHCADRGLYGSLKDIDQEGIRVIVNPGGSNERFVRENLHNAQIFVHPDNLTVFSELEKGAADLMITDAIEVEWQSRRSDKLCSLSRKLLSRANKAYLVPKDQEFVSEVNIWLEQIQRSGQLAQRMRQALQSDY